MAIGVAQTARLQDSEEAAARLDVAACYRLISLYGLSDFTDGFASARVGDTDDFVVGGYGLFPELATVSALHRRSLHAEPALEKFGGVDTDAHLFTRTAFDARPGINACIHAHAPWLVALSAVEGELEPVSQWGVMYHGLVGYLDFDTTDVTSPDCCAVMGGMLARGLQAIILRNHGVLTTGATVAQAFFALHRLELASQLQLMAIQSGRPLVGPGPQKALELRETYWTMTRVDNDGAREWPGLLEKLDRIDRGYRE